MQNIGIAAALTSAVLHAGWNAAVKASPRPDEAMGAQMMSSALLVLPILAVIGLPSLASVPWIAASMTFNTLIVVALLRSYELAGFGIGYTFSRALSVTMVVPLAAAIAGDWVSGPQMAGIALIVSALAVLAFGAGREKPIGRTAILWILLAGGSTASYVICDAQGVRAAGSALAYGCATTFANACAMAFRLRRVKSPVGVLRDNWRIGVPASVAAVISYLLILWVWSHAPIAPAAALRDTSSVFAIIIATLFLKEPMTRARLVAVALAILAVPLLRLG